MSYKTKLKIGAFSQLMQVSVKTLRFYEQKDLLQPHEVDEWTGYRFYSVDQMQKLNAIREFRRLGFSLDEIKELYDDNLHEPSIEQLNQKIDDAERDLKELITRRNLLLDKRNARKEMNIMEKFSIQSLPEIIVASHREVIPSYAALGQKLVQKCIDWVASVRYQDTASPLSMVRNGFLLILTLSIVSRSKRWVQTLKLFSLNDYLPYPRRFA